MSMHEMFSTVIQGRLGVRQLISKHELSSIVKSSNDILELTIFYVYFVGTIRVFPVNSLSVKLRFGGVAVVLL